MNRLLPLTLCAVLTAATQTGAQPISAATGAATLTAPPHSLTRTRSGDKPMAAGVAIAGLLANAEPFAGKNVVVIVCGGNISRATLKKVI